MEDVQLGPQERAQLKGFFPGMCVCIFVFAFNQFVYDSRSRFKKQKQKTWRHSKYGIKKVVRGLCKCPKMNNKQFN